MNETETTTAKETEAKKVRKRRAGLEEFLRVCLEEQNVESAAKRLDLTVSSFDQRLRREKARYEEAFMTIDTAKFSKGHVGRTPPKPNEALAMLAKLKGMSVEDLKAQIDMKREKVEIKPPVEASQEATVEQPKPVKPVKTKSTK
jgi:hypothetical protein